MTARAREALADCEYALADFAASATTSFRRSRWVAVTTLLRTVGLVLKAVDHPAADVATQERIDTAWDKLNASKPEPRIFWEFIDDERYQVVHLYDIRSGVDYTEMSAPQPLGYFLMMSDEDDDFGWSPSPSKFIMRKGPFAGRDPVDLCREAIEFWRDYLAAIDRTGPSPVAQGGKE